jgi:hypothetical protein
MNNTNVAAIRNSEVEGSIGLLILRVLKFCDKRSLKNKQTYYNHTLKDIKQNSGVFKICFDFSLNA